MVNPDRSLRVARRTVAALSLAALGCIGEPDLRPLLQDLAVQTPKQDWHIGPEVEINAFGTARFVSALHAAYQPRRALELVGFIDRFYRAPANEGYDTVIDRLAKDLLEAGFDSDPRLKLDVLVSDEPERAWTPVRAELVLLVDGEEPRVLHKFVKSEDVDRVMLPVNAPSCDVTGEVALQLDQVKKGMLLVTSVPGWQVMTRAEDRGAAAVISASLEPFNEDPSGAQRHHDAIQFHTKAGDMPTAQISPRSLRVIEAAVERAAKRGAKVRLRLQSEVKFEERPLRTLVATIVGAKLPGEAVAMVSHVQEPGACDNASGVAGLVEGARSLVELLKADKLRWPSRSLVFVWGDEFRQSRAWLEKTDMLPIAGISSDMTGQSKDTGAIALLERNPDPGALSTLPPDAHTPWGAGEVDIEELKPNGFAVIARCAMADVTLLENGNWISADHPWEGGSDHDIFIKRGIPAVLFWHFTDFTYHTSLDRMSFVEPEEMRRTGVALLATALAVACPEPTDLDRYLKSLDRERVLRIAAAEEVNDVDLAGMWDEWSLGAREWLRNLCLGIDEKIPEPK